MNQTQSLLQPLASFEQLVGEIITLNQAWKVACEKGNSDSQIITSMRNIKTRWQVRLLRLYAPDRVYLKLDPEAKSDEEHYGLILRDSKDKYWSVTHIPVRVVRSIFSDEEIQRFCQDIA